MSNFLAESILTKTKILVNSIATLKQKNFRQRQKEIVAEIDGQIEKNIVSEIDDLFMDQSRGAG